jgi:integrase
MRTAEHSARELGSRSSRFKLPIQDRPYFTHVQHGLSLGYRQGKRGGSWIARAHDTEHGYRYAALGQSNDLIESFGMSFQAAQVEARLWYGQLASIDSGELVAGAYSVRAAMDDYLAHSEREKRKTLPDTRTAINAHIVPALGHIELSKLTHSKVKSWRDSVAASAPRVRTKTDSDQAYRTLDPNDVDATRKRQATANRILTILKAALNHAHAESKRVSSKAAWETVKPFRKVDVAKIRFMTTDEVTSLMKHCDEDFGSIVRGALLTGCRYGELASLRVHSFDPHNETIFVAKSKNGEPRHIELNAEGIAFFAALTRNRDSSARMFLRSNGKAWKKSEQKRPMDDACSKAEIEHVTFHILRHTYASHLAMNQTPMRVIADQLGHKDTRITERHYAHLGRAFVRETIRTKLPHFGLIEPSQLAA